MALEFSPSPVSISLYPPTIGGLFVSLLDVITKKLQQTCLFQIKVLVDYVKKAFKDYLLRKIWMDAKTKQHASGKVCVFTMMFMND